MTTKVNVKILAEDSKPLQWTNTGAAVAARTLVLLVGGIIGVAQADIAVSSVTDTTKIGILHTAGVYEIAKNTGITFVAGEAVFWDSTNSRVDKAGTANAIYLGIAYKSAASADTLMWVDLNARPTLNFASITVTSGQAAANSGDGQVDIVTGLTATPTWISPPLVIDQATPTGVPNVGYKMDLSVAGTITIKGVSSGIQLDAGDILKIAWIA